MPSRVCSVKSVGWSELRRNLFRTQTVIKVQITKHSHAERKKKILRVRGKCAVPGVCIVYTHRLTLRGCHLVWPKLSCCRGHCRCVCFRTAEGNNASIEHVFVVNSKKRIKVTSPTIDLGSTMTQLCHLFSLHQDCQVRCCCCCCGCC